MKFVIALLALLIVTVWTLAFADTGSFTTFKWCQLQGGAPVLYRLREKTVHGQAGYESYTGDMWFPRSLVLRCTDGSLEEA